MRASQKVYGSNSFFQSYIKILYHQQDHSFYKNLWHDEQAEVCFAKPHAIENEELGSNVEQKTYVWQTGIVLIQL